MTEEDATLATATEQPPLMNECQEEGGASMNRWRSNSFQMLFRLYMF